MTENTVVSNYNNLRDSIGSSLADLITSYNGITILI
jgi:hypothetical protein